MKVFKLTLLVGVMAFLYGCEKCSDCTLTMYDGTCTCEIFGVSSSVEYNNLDEDENAQIKQSCEISSICTYFEDPSTTDKEECGKKKDVEDAVDDRERDGYVCSDIE
jgi:hypothetical protein